jgi:hypothetical protein
LFDFESCNFRLQPDLKLHVAPSCEYQADVWKNGYDRVSPVNGAAPLTGRARLSGKEGQIGASLANVD